jgi:imidazolonepropionase-like amidohydrolase
VIAAGLLAAALAVSVFLALRPPAPLAVPARGFVLADVHLVMPGLGSRPHQTLRGAGSIIDAISDHSPADGAAAGTYAGSWVLPGLVDLHVHHPIARLETDVELFGLLHLLHGVTAVRDCGSIDGSILDVRRRVASGERAGPRIFACGPLIDGDPPAWPGAEAAASAADGSRIADAAAASGVDCLKVYSNLSAEALRGVREAATRHALPLVGHVPSSVPFEEARIEDVQHLTGLPAADAGEGAGLIARLLAGWDELAPERIDLVARVSREQGIAHTPTMVVIERLLALEDPQALAGDPAARLLPRHYREILWAPGGVAGWTFPPLGAQRRARIRANFCEAIRRLHVAGVVLHVGSDSLNPFVVPGAGLHEELRNFAECGFTPEEAWQAATRGNGAALSLPGLGLLEPGAPADLLVFGEDPTREASRFASLRAVVADGRLYPRDVLEEALARYREYHERWLVERVTALLFALLADR